MSSLKQNNRGKYVACMEFTPAEMKILEDLSAHTGLTRVGVVRLAMREYARKIGVDTMGVKKVVDE